MRTPSLFLCVLLVFLFPFGKIRSETILLEHNFQGDASSPLDGQAVEAGANKVTWSSSNVKILADGTVSGDGKGNYNAYLPFKPEPGFLYTFTVTLTLANPLSDTSGEAVDFVAIGLCQQPAANRLLPLASSASILFRRNGKGESFILQKTDTATEGLEPFKRVHFVHEDPTVKLGIVLDTRQPSWNVTCRVDGEDIGGAPLPPNTEIEFLGIGQARSASVRFSNLELTGKKEDD